MRLFISWSQENSLSHQVALALRDWIPLILQPIEPFVSAEDIHKGEQWVSNLAAELKQTAFCIICVTKANLHSAWIHFEAGAVFNSFGRGRVCPLLLDIDQRELVGPLTQFQTARATHDDILRLLHSINQNLDTPIHEARVNQLFSALWPDFEAKLDYWRTHNQATDSFWGAFFQDTPPHEPVSVVLSAKQGVDWIDGQPSGKPGHTPQLAFNEVNAFLNLERTLTPYYRALRLVHGGIRDAHTNTLVIPDFPEDSTLIVVGSSHANPICKRVLARAAPLPYRFETNAHGKCIHVYQDALNEWHETPVAVFPEPDSIALEEDFGILLRITNPLDASRRSKVLVLGGNHGFGTESALNYVADTERVNSLQALVAGHDFMAVYEASVGRGRGLKLGLCRLAIVEGGQWYQLKGDS